MNAHQEAAQASQDAYQHMMATRERLVSVLRARGVTGFSSL